MSGTPYLYIGNENKPLSKLNGYESGSFIIGASIPGDPAYGCPKNFVSTYMCGNKIKSINMPGESGGQTAVFDCSKEVKECDNNSNFAVIGNDGNFSIYKGNDPSNTGQFIWSSNTPGINTSTGTNLLDNNNKTILRTGDKLSVGEKLMNSNKNGYITMRNNGSIDIVNRKLNQSINTDGDIIGSGGNSPSFALYEITPKSNSKDLFKTGYIDIDGILHEYPANLSEYKDKYTKIADTNAPGYDISDLGIIGKEACEQNCNSRTDCGIYQMDKDGHCWLKKESAYKNGNVYNSSGMDTYLRMKGPLQRKFEYKSYIDKESTGHDISCTSDNTRMEIQTQCDKDPKCASYNWNKSTNTGCLKNDTSYSDGNTASNLSSQIGTDYYIKQTSKGSSSFLGSCSQDVVGINSSRWGSYMKGEDMSQTTKCGLARITEKDKIEIQKSEQRLNILIQKMKTKINGLTTKEQSLNKYFIDYYTKVETDFKKFKNNFAAYKKSANEEDMIEAWVDDSETQRESYNNKLTIFSIISVVLLIAIVKLNK